MKRRKLFKALACTAIAMRVLGASKPDIPKLKTIYADSATELSDDIMLSNLRLYVKAHLQREILPYLSSDEPIPPRPLYRSINNLTKTLGHEVVCVGFNETKRSVEVAVRIYTPNSTLKSTVVTMNFTKHKTVARSKTAITV